jgi:hypothetical protein
MQPSDYRKARDAAVGEIQEVLQKRALLDERLNQLKKTVNALSDLLEDSPHNPADPESYADATGISVPSIRDAGGMGISKVIRLALANSKTPMTPVDIKAALARIGFDVGQYSNAMSVIHNTLKRLEAQGELIAVGNAAAQVTAYALKSALQHDPIEEALGQTFKKK